MIPKISNSVETAEGGMWPLWCHSHNRARALWCTTCTTAVCGECRGGDHRGHQVSCEDNRGGAATRWPIPGEWRGWWGNRTNFLKEIAEEEGATVRFDEKGGPVSLVGPHRAIKKIGDAMRRERGGRRTAPRRRTSPPPRRSSPPPRRTSPGRTRGAPVGRGGVGSGAGGTSLRITFVITLSKVRKDLNIYFLLKIKQNINWSYHYIPDHHGNIQDSRST